MSHVLVLTRGFGPFQGQAVSRLQENGHSVHIYDVNGQWLTYGAPVPLWMRGYRLKRSPLATGYFTQYIERRGIDHVVTFGLPAGAMAADDLSLPFVPVLGRGDLDFSAARAEQAADFDTLLAGTGLLLLEDEWEMDKACAKGSRAAHLRSAQLLEDETPCLSRQDEVRVGVLHPESMDPERLRLHVEGLRAELGPDAEITGVTVESLFHRRDLVRKRRFAPTVRDRLSGFTQLIVLGSSAHHAAILGAVWGDRGRLVVEATIGSATLSRELGVQTLGRGVRVAELAAAMSRGEAPAPVPVTHPRTVPAGVDVLPIWDDLLATDHPDGHEELAVHRGTGPVDVFFSVAPLQDRTDGARPQRIRNMADAMDRPEPALRVFANRALFDRRARQLAALLDGGRPAGLLYGENSTSPIPDAALIEDVADLVREFGRRGGRSAWFVRDLHWLDDVEGYLADEDTRSTLVGLGLHELDEMGGAADLLLAPSDASGRGFDDLLRRHGLEGWDWFPSPPGVDPGNVVGPEAARGSEPGITLLYAGGLNSVYSMDRYLESIQGLDGRFLLDFVVRESEKGRLAADLDRHGIPVDDRVRLITAELDHYRPRTADCFGVILLDSEYARFSFPYKTVSMLEHGFPILCFEDMGIASFVRDNGLGVACERSATGVRDGIEELTTVGAPGLAEARHTQSWEARIAEVRARLLQD
ncbi:hypothetical protein ABZ787_06845 [Micrococcus luteus]|uniref:hypothetical protein n=1 Tax=Micrococcus luteus TaxID=1270 RepID=UPI002A729B6B|nr:hypothetical protein [Micrococcus luteus]